MAPIIVSKLRRRPFPSFATAVKTILRWGEKRMLQHRQILSVTNNFKTKTAVEKPPFLYK
jgi:hypothetical protein